MTAWTKGITFWCLKQEINFAFYFFHAVFSTTNKKYFLRVSSYRKCIFNRFIDEQQIFSIPMAGFLRITFFFLQSFLDLEYAFLEVKPEEPARPRKTENIDILSRKKMKIKKKKKRKKKMNELLATELSTNNETVTESKSELPSLPESHSEPVLQNDILSSFPDTPPSFDHVPCSKEIESPAWRHV